MLNNFHRFFFFGRRRLKKRSEKTEIARPKRFHRFQHFRQFSNLFSQNWLKSDRRHSFLEFGAKSGKMFIKNSQKKCKTQGGKLKKSEIQVFNHEKNVDDFWLKFWDIEERCKGVHCLDLGESFPTSIYLQKSASIQPRTIPSKFGGKIQLNIHSPP